MHGSFDVVPLTSTAKHDAAGLPIVSVVPVMKTLTAESYFCAVMRSHRTFRAQPPSGLGSSLGRRPRRLIPRHRRTTDVRQRRLR